MLDAREAQAPKRPFDRRPLRVEDPRLRADEHARVDGHPALGAAALEPRAQRLARDPLVHLHVALPRPGNDVVRQRRRLPCPGRRSP